MAVCLRHGSIAQRAVRVPILHLGRQLGRTKVGRVEESSAGDGSANISTIGVEIKDIRHAERRQTRAWISFLGLVLDDERSIELCPCLSYRLPCASLSRSETADGGQSA